MAQRQKLHEIFAKILLNEDWKWNPFDFENDTIYSARLKDASKRVYFQPPENVKLSYPCIIYNLDNKDTQFADNIPYSITNRYYVEVIDRNPDSEISDNVAKIPMCTFDRQFTSNYLTHYTYRIYW